MGAEIKTKINIEGDLSSLETSLKQISNQLGQLKLPDSFATSAAKIIDKVQERIDSLREQTKDGELNLINRKKVMADVQQIDSVLYSLRTKLTNSNTFDHIITKEAAKTLEKINTIQTSYNGKLSETDRIEQKLKKQRDNAIAAQLEQVEAAEKLKVVTEGEYAAKDRAFKMAKKELDLTLQAQKEATAKKEERYKKSGGKYQDDNSPGARHTKEYQDEQKAIQACEEAQRSYTEAMAAKDGITTLKKQTELEETLKANIDKATQALADYQAKAKQTSQEEAFKSAIKELQQLGIATDNIKNSEDLENFFENTQKSAEEAAAGLRDFSDSLDKAAVAQDNMTTATVRGSEALDQQNERSKKVDGIVQRIKQFVGLSGAIMLFRKAASSAFNTIKELDAQMTEMAVVTDKTISDYWDQLPEHTKRANELGISIKGVYEAETLYYQQGLKTAEVIEMSNSTLRMARIAGLDAAEATNKMTAALRGFNMELNGASADRVADVYSKLAAITASNVDEISTAMTKTASIAANAGMEFETTAAFLSQIIETTRESAETAGTALKTVIARFQELKKDPSEIGEIDGEIVDANKIETALRSVGVSLRDSSGQFRELDDVFMELAKKWDSLETNTQRYIATIAAGSRQQSRFIAMMSDYSRTIELVSAANNSAGASAEQFSKTLESMEIKLQKLKNSWDTFTMGLMNNAIFKMIATALTGILDFLNKITTNGNDVVSTLLKFGLVIVIFKGASLAIQGFMTTFQATNSVAAASVGAFKAIGTSLSGTWARLTAVQSNNYRATAQGAKVYRAFNTTSKQTIHIGGQEISGYKARQWAVQQYASTLGMTNKQASMSLYLQKKGYPAALANAAVTKAETVSQAELNLQKNLGIVAEGAMVPIKTEEALASEKLAVAQAEENAVNNAGIIGKLRAIGMSIINWVNKKKEAKTSLESAGAAGAEAVATGINTGAKVGETAATKAQTAANSGLLASMAPVILGLLTIAAIIAAIVAIVWLIYKAVKKAKENSLEGQLKRDQKALEETTERLNETIEAYDKLGESIDKLHEAQDTFKTLTRGSIAWKKQILEINKQVMDLIEQYPELAAKVKLVDGVMTIADKDLIEAQENKLNELQVQEGVKMIQAQRVAEDKRKIAERAVTPNMGDYRDHSSETESRRALPNAKNKEGKYITEVLAEAMRNPQNDIEAKIANEDYSKETLQEYLKSKGFEIELTDTMVKQLDEAKSSIKKFGESLDSVDNAAKQAAQAMVAQALANRDYTEEESANMSEVLGIMAEGNREAGKQAAHEGNLSVESYNNAKNSDRKKKKIAKERRKTEGYEDFIKKKYGTDDIGFDDFGNVIVKGEKKTGEINKNWEEFLIQKQGLASTEEDAAKLNETLKTMGKSNAVYNKIGSKQKMTQKDFADFEKTSSQITDERQREALEQVVNQAKEDWKKTQKDLADVLEKDSDQLTKATSNLSSGMMQGLINQLNNLPKDATAEAKQKLTDTYLNILNDDSLTEKQREQIAEQFGALDLTDIDAVDNFRLKMIDLTENIPGMTEKFANLDTVITETANSIHKMTAEEFGEWNKGIQNIIKGLREGNASLAYSQEDYDTIIKKNADLRKDFKKMYDGTYVYQKSAMELMASLWKNSVEVGVDAIRAETDATKKKEEAEKMASSMNASDLLDQYIKETDEELKRAYKNELEARGADLSAFDTNALEVIDAVGGNILGALASRLGGLLGSDAMANWGEQQLQKQKEKRQQREEQAKGSVAEQIVADQFDALYQATQNVTIAQEKVSKSLENYNQALIDGTSSASDIVKKRKEYIDSLKNEGAALEEQKRQQDKEVNEAIAKANAAFAGEAIKSTLKTTKTFTIKQLTNYDAATGIYTGKSIEELKALGITDITDIEKLQSYVKTELEGLNEKSKARTETETRVNENKKSQYEEARKIREDRDALLKALKDADVKMAEKQIEEMEELKSTLEDFQGKILDGMRDQIDAYRAERDKQKTEDDITDKETRLAYLIASGASATEIESLQKEIEEARQDQTDQLIDEQLDKIEDANERAAEQRQQQIDIQQAQLELLQESTNWEHYIQLADQNIQDLDSFKESKVGKMLIHSVDGFDNLTAEAKENVWQELWQKFVNGLGITLPAHANGGLVNYTGPSWLDGSPNSPELVLDANDTKNFLALRDILSEVLRGMPTQNNEQTRTTYIDVDINVDSLTSDYDVNEVARQVQDYIAEEALYRNSTMVTNRR